MYGLILFLPLLNALLLLLLGRFIGKSGAIEVTLIHLFFLFSAMVYAIYELLYHHNSVFFSLGKWFFFTEIHVDWEFKFDAVTISMLFMIVSISSMVHIYSISYMALDPHQIRFLSYLSLFTFFMIFLVTSNNFVGLFVGWEGVGLCSYLLINFWSTRISANKAALKAMIMNRIGDSGLLLAMGALAYYYGTLNFETLFALIPYMSYQTFTFFGFSIDVLSFIAFLCFVGVMGKSAQIGLHTWLPDAMEGPTPVSALIHAATMVTAGVFFLIRLSPLLEYVPLVLSFILLIGVLTLFISGTVSSSQNDIKKIIAYSTCSQLGLAVLLCGLSSYSVALYHLLNHAFFKALLFLIAGCIIHNFSEEQDVRRMGSFLHFFPFSYLGMLIASLAMSGLPFFSGFYSKELMLELHSLSTSLSWSHYALFFFSLISSFFTAFYSFRLLHLVFYAPYHGYKKNLYVLHFDSVIRLLPLVFLLLGAIVVGYLLSDIFDVWNLTLFFGSIMVSPTFVSFIDVHLKAASTGDFLCLVKTVFSDLTIFTLFVLILAFELSYLYSRRSLLTLKNIYFFYSLGSNKWFFDKVYNEYIAEPVMRFSYVVPYAHFDKGIFELIGPQSMMKFYLFIKRALSSIHDGLVSTAFNQFVKNVYLFIFLLFLGVPDMIAVSIYVTFGYFIIFDDDFADPEELRKEREKKRLKQLRKARRN